MPIVSVNVAAYNCGKYLRQTLDSVLAQTLTDWECIVVDDASADDTLAIAREYEQRDSRFKVIALTPQTKQPYPAIRNTLLNASTGKWIAVLDSDDWWEPWKLERQVQALSDNPRALLCCVKAKVWKNGQVIGNTPYVPSDQMGHMLPVRNVIAHPAVMYDRQAVVDIGGYGLQMKTAQDWDLWTRMLWKYGKDCFISLEDEGTFYRRHDTNVTSNPVRCFEFEMIVVRNTLKHCGWGLLKPVLAWRVLNYWANRGVELNRMANHPGQALYWATVWMLLLPIKRWRWMQVFRVLGEWYRFKPTPVSE